MIIFMTVRREKKNIFLILILLYLHSIVDFYYAEPTDPETRLHDIYLGEFLTPININSEH